MMFGCRFTRSILKLTQVGPFGTNHGLLYKWTVHGWLVLKCQHHNWPQHQYEIKVNYWEPDHQPFSSKREETYQEGQWVLQTYQGSKSSRRRSTSLDLKEKVIKLGGGWQVKCRSTDSLDCLLSKWSDSRSALPTDSHTSPPPGPTRKGSDEPEPNKADLRVDHHLWGD